jgi:tetratricopeptide (TPR) repeat protein
MRRAVELYRRIHNENHPYQPIVLRIFAEALIRQGKIEQAEAETRKAAETYPEISAYRELLGRVYAWRGDWAAALRVFDADHCLCQRAIIFLQLGDVDAYRSARKILLNVVPQLETGHNVKTVLLTPIEIVDRIDIQRFVDHADPEEPAAWRIARARIDKSLAAIRIGRFETANEWATRATKTDARLPNQAQAWFIRALAFQGLNQWDQAAQAITKGNELLDAPDRKLRCDLLEDWSEWSVAEILRREAFEGMHSADRASAID